MHISLTGPRPEVATEESLYIGMITTGIIALLPYVNVFLFPAYVMGPLLAVWHATSRGGQTLQFKEGAKLGFLSTFFGSMIAVVLFDLLWQFLDYQLWQRQDAELMLAIVRSFASPAVTDTMAGAFAQNETRAFEWPTLVVQLLGNGVICGIVGAPAGLIAAKLFARE